MKKSLLLLAFFSTLYLPSYGMVKYIKKGFDYCKDVITQWGSASTSDTPPPQPVYKRINLMNYEECKQTLAYHTYYNNPTLCIEALERMIMLVQEPEMLQAHTRDLALLYMDLERYEQAITTFNHYRSMYPGDTEFIPYVDYYLIGSLYASRAPYGKDISKTRNAYRETTEFFKKYPEGVNQTIAEYCKTIQEVCSVESILAILLRLIFRIDFYNYTQSIADLISIKVILENMIKDEYQQLLSTNAPTKEVRIIQEWYEKNITLFDAPCSTEAIKELKKLAEKALYALEAYHETIATARKPIAFHTWRQS